MEHRLTGFRSAAKVHRDIRHELQSYIKPGRKLIDICEFIESRIRKGLKGEVNDGIAFPVGVSMNHIAAHWTPYTNNDMTVLGADDVLKVDYGTHVDGNIIDSAFTYAYDTGKYQPLIEASKEAVDAILNNIGVDSRIGELGGLAEEVVSSYEILLDNRILPLKPINNIAGHSINQWQIHGGKYIQGIRNNSTTFIEENDVLAIEIYVTTGCGTTIPEGPPSHFMVPKGVDNKYSRKFRTLPFCQRYTDPADPADLEGLISFPPLVEPLEHSYISQTEHTIHINETVNEIFS
jgi:methionyl aminopeptidase